MKNLIITFQLKKLATRTIKKKLIVNDVQNMKIG